MDGELNFLFLDVGKLLQQKVSRQNLLSRRLLLLAVIAVITKGVPVTSKPVIPDRAAVVTIVAVVGGLLPAAGSAETVVERSVVGAAAGELKPASWRP